MGLVLLALALVTGMRLVFGADGSQQTIRFEGTSPVEVTAKVAPEAKPGDTVTVEFHVAIDRGWHIYGLEQDPDAGTPTSIAVRDNAQGFAAAGQPTEPPPHPRHDPLLGDLLEHDGKVKFTLPVQVPKTLAGGEYRLPVRFEYVACDAEHCLIPHPLDFDLALKVVASSTPAAEPKPTAQSERGEKITKRADLAAPVEVSTHGFTGVTPGEVLEIELRAAIDRGWHLYGLKQPTAGGIPTRITIPDPRFELAGDVTESEPHIYHSDLMGSEMHEHEGTATFRVPVRIPSDLEAGTYELPIDFEYQVCDANSCLDPATVKLKLPIQVGAADAAPSASTGSQESTSQGPASKDSTDPSATTTGAKAGAKVTRTESPASPVRVTSYGFDEVEPGEVLQVQFTADIDRGWHLYGLEDQYQATQLAVRENQLGFVATGAPTETPARPGVDALGPRLKHEFKAIFTLPVRVPETLEKGEHTLPVSFTYEVCDIERCLPPATLDFDLPIHVGQSAPPPPENGSATTTPTERIDGPESLPEADEVFTFSAEFDRAEVVPGGTVKLQFEGKVHDSTAMIPAVKPSIVDDAKSAGFWGIIWASILGALVALITPCVYPMIPITVSIFTKQAEQNRAGVLRLALIFCGGIIVTFTGIGLILAAALGEEGAAFMASNAWVNLVLGGLFVYFAFSLFGYYDISLPSWLTNRATGAGSKGGTLSVILMGFIFSITTFTCVGPIVATLLALAVQGGQTLAFVGMLAFGTTFALPFFFLALFPKVLSGMPRSGGWLNNVKVALGFVELAAAFKFFAVVPFQFGANLLFRELVLLIWAIIFGLTAAYLLGLFKFSLDSPIKKRGPIRWAFVGLFVFFTGYCLYGASGRLVAPTLEAQLMQSFFHVSGRHDSDGAGSDEENGAGEEGEDPHEHGWRESVVLAMRESEFWSTVFKTDAKNVLPWRIYSKETGGDPQEYVENYSGDRPIFINFTGHT